jgi:hypothetical protein
MGLSREISLARSRQFIRERKDDIKGVHCGKNSGLVAALPAHYGKNSGSGPALAD